jgi:hypothetical protein
MKIHNILSEDAYELKTIAFQCSQFLEESNGEPLLKNLPRTYNNINKVKVRKRRGQEFDQKFNEAFDYYKLRERSIFTSGNKLLLCENDDQELFYVFPVNGYKFLFSAEIENSKDELNQTFESIVNEIGPDVGDEIIVDMLRLSYTDQYLAEGIRGNSEIIIYNIPHYYAVRATSEYQSVLTNINES